MDKKWKEKGTFWFFSDANGNPKYVNFYFSSFTEATDFAIKNHYQSYQVLSDYEFQE